MVRLEARCYTSGGRPRSPRRRLGALSPTSRWRRVWARDSDTGNSDHREFELAGLPGAVLEVWKGVFPCHHLACDRAGLLQKPALKRALRIAEEVVKGL